MTGGRGPCAAVALWLAACASAPASGSPYDAFGAPRRVTIRAYTGDAMEPFVSRDGRFLFFNTRNDPGTNTDIHYAERIDEATFAYRGPLAGANSPQLDAVVSMDASGALYFVSTRSYDQALETIHRGRFSDGTLANVQLVPDLSLQHRGRINFDVEVTPDGDALYFADGLFAGAAVPERADLVLAVRSGATFKRVENGVLARVNTDALEYAAAITADGLELFFTRATRSGPAIFRSTRSGVAEAFGPGQRISAIEGFAEGPSISADGRALYFHRRDPDSRLRIYLVTR